LPGLLPGQKGHAMSSRRLLGYVIAPLACAALCPSAAASFHLMQIEQVIGGVNGDVTEQAIQLRMRAAGQNLVSQARIRAWDAAGANPVLIINIGANVPISAAGSRVLITSANFNDDTTPATVPNFTMTNLIPPSYFAAGSLTFESDAGVVYWRLSWGGAAYTGSCAVNVANDSNQNACPAWPGPLPTVCTKSLLFPGLASAMSTTNAADYVLSASNPTFVNNAGTPFVLGGSNAGACCLTDGTCAEALLAADCSKMGGTFQGECTTCAASNCQPPATGACCLLDGTCTDNLSPTACGNNGGVYQGDGTTCAGVSCPQPAVGACCLTDGTCVDAQTSNECLTAGGTYQGDLSKCSGVECPLPPLGACCIDKETCIELLEPDCFEAGGVYQGDFSTCGPNTCGKPCAGDVNGDGTVNVNDLLAVISSWGPGGGGTPADQNGDGTVDVDDLLIVIGGWGACA
jgi:hypothetical protein